MDNQNGKNTPPGGNNQGGNGQMPKRPSLVMLLVAALVSLLCMSYFMSLMSGATNEVSYNEFLTMVDEGKVASVKLASDRINITLADEDKKNTNPFQLSEPTVTYYTGNVNDDTLVQHLMDKKVEIKGEVQDNSGFLLSILLTYVLPIALVWIVLSMLFKKMSKGGGMMGVGKSNAKVYVQKETGITFKDVAGEDEAKESLQEVVDFLHNPTKYAKIGAKLPKGALLVGPPGTGKTLLAKAVAGEAKVPFFSLAGSDFIEMYVGVGASRVRDLFKEATKNAPCIIFIDEIDAIGRSRDSKYGGGNEEREQTLNQLLSEMDGFDTSKGILILAATNRPEILDKALLRPGRFDRRIIVDKPDLKGRVEILKVHAKDVLMDDSVDFDAIALATSGAVGSDLANMINEGAINAVKEGREYVCQKDLFDAVELVLVGKEKKDRIMSPEERKIVSYHEVGHALVSALQKNSEPVQKITIVPRTMGALGYVMHVPEEEKFLNTEAELRDMLVGLVAGRAAEEIVFETVTTGASNDIEKATSIARAMVTQYGMSKHFGLVGLETVESKYLDGRSALNCSDTTAAEIDTEVTKILKDSYKQAKKLLKENRKLMDKLAAHLIEKETITGKEFMKIFRKEKGIPEPIEKQDEEKKTSSKQESAAGRKVNMNPAKDASMREMPNGVVINAESGKIDIGSIEFANKGYTNQDVQTTEPSDKAIEMKPASDAAQPVESVQADPEAQANASAQTIETQQTSEPSVDQNKTQFVDTRTEEEKKFAEVLQNRVYQIKEPKDNNNSNPTNN
ncbi:MAG: ATP-dependent zinc metalloprotease FtsH [Lachnospiraceae bacterium]|nr:ATP-dependent zinc metalloprotease FtsH [Lachnospiraceae bacterium]